MYKRAVGLFALVAVLFSALNLLTFGAVMSVDKAQRVADSQGKYVLDVYSGRGGIYDCNFSPLVNNEVAYKGTIIPSNENIVLLNNDYFKEDRQWLAQKMASRYPFVLSLPGDDFNLPGLECFSIPIRYSKNQILQHFIGYLGTSSGKGICGLEYSYDSFLTQSAKQIKVRYEVDGLGQSLAGVEPEILSQGSDKTGIVLTVDSRIQGIAEEVGSKTLKAGAIVVLEAATGQIKASASFPQFDSTDITKSIQLGSGAMLNRPVTGYNLGSVYKLVIAAAALENGFSEHFTYKCTGHIQVSDVSFRCHKLDGHGTLDMSGAIEQSCNPYFIELGSKVGAKNIVEMSRKLGFGSALILGDELYSDRGYLPDVSELKNAGDVANLCFGQGKLMSTPMQVAAMMTAIVNDGALHPPYLVKGFTDESGKKLQSVYTPPEVRKVFSATTAQKIRGFMINAIEKGTSGLAKPTYNMAGGKSSSAQSGQYDGTREIIRAWFSGFYPAQSPKYIVVVVCDDGKSGSATTGPIFKEICDRLETLE